MFLAIKKFAGIKNPETFAKKIESGLLPEIKNYTGFVAYYAVKFENGEHGGVGVFDSKANLETAIEQSGSWMKKNLSDVVSKEPEVIKGEVLFDAKGKTLATSA